MNIIIGIDTPIHTPLRYFPSSELLKCTQRTVLKYCQQLTILYQSLVGTYRNQHIGIEDLHKAMHLNPTKN